MKTNKNISTYMTTEEYNMFRSKDDFYFKKFIQEVKKMKLLGKKLDKSKN